MTANTLRRLIVSVGLIALLPGAAAAWPDGEAAESRRMSRAKDLIADEQWARAIEELRAAVADPRETNKDEALFWLAHSQNQENDFAAAVDSIRRLEREHASSRWVKPARSLLIELAQKLKRDDVLWWTAVAPPRPHPLPHATTPPPPIAPPERPRRPGAATRVETPAPAGGERVPVSAVAPAPPPPPHAWGVETWSFDADQRIQALGSLIHTDAEKVIPLLRHIALEEDNPGAARRAVFVLAESRRPEALSIVVEVATRGPEPVRVAAVRGLGSFGGPEVSKALLKVYSTGNAPLKRQVVMALGARLEASALLRIAQSEEDRSLRASAIITLGRAGGRAELQSLYAKADQETKRPIIIGLFTARGEDELIRIADKEKDPQVRAEVLSRLRLLGTPKARAYLEQVRK